MFKDTHLCLLTRACSFTSCRQCGEKPLSIDCSQSWLSTSGSNEGGIKGKYHSSSLVSEVLPPAVIVQVHWYAQLTIQTSGFLATKAISLSIYLILSIACFVLVSTTGLTCHSPPSMPSAWGCSGVPHNTHQSHHRHRSLLRLGHRVCKQDHGDFCCVKLRTVNCSFSRAQRLVAQAVAAEPEVMQTVEVSLGDRSYPIYIGQGLLDRSDLLQQHVLGKKVLIVTNETVAPLYLDRCVLPQTPDCV